MKRNKPQFWRLLELDRFIRTGQYPNCLTFSKHWEVSQKTIQRDIEYMKYSLGAPIEYDRNRKGYFYSHPNWFLPALSMSEGDLFSLLIASRALEQYRGSPVAGELERIFRKIVELLPDKLSIRPEFIFTRFSFRGPPAKPVNEKIWTTIVRGLLGQRTVEITYRSFESHEKKDRQIDPYHVANLRGEWYVFAWCNRSEEIRQFAIPRIEKARLMHRTFSVSEDFDPDAFLSTAFGRFTSTDNVHNIRLLFNKEVTDWVLEREWHPSQKIKKRKNGDIELSFKTAGLLEVFFWVMGWGHYIRVLEPKELVEWAETEVKLMAKRTRDKKKE